MTFQDHFSGHAGDYARFRPRYPADLFDWLARQAPGHKLAWDCGTGSGQAAVALTRHFDRVVASDPSAEQLQHAERHTRVEYVVAPAERPPAQARGASLVTCAQSYHWFDHDRFCSALGTWLQPGAVLAVWGYGLASISPAIDAIVLHYYSNIVGTYWPPDRRHIESRYQTLPFPFAEMSAPDFAMSAVWTLGELIGYLGTWSASRRYRGDSGVDPLLSVRADLTAAWGSADRRQVIWPLFLRAGSVPGGPSIRHNSAESQG